MTPVSFILVVSTLHLCSWLSGSVVEQVKTCPKSKNVWDASARRKECGTKEGDYHCVRNQDDKLVELCVPKVWIKGGYCPVLHEANGKFSDELCFTGHACPLFKYLSNTVYMYPVCFEKKLNEIAPSTTSVASNTTVNSNIIDSSGNTQTQNWTATVIACIAAIVPGCVILSIVAYCKRKSPRRKPDQKDLETGGEDERQAFLSEKKDSTAFPQVYLIQPLDATIDDVITIHCVIRGNSPATSISWKKDGAPVVIADNDKYEGGNIAEPDLTIKKVSPDDAGIYQCSATSEDGTGESELVNLNVLENHHIFQDIDVSERKPIEYLLKAGKNIEEEGIAVIVGDIGSGKTTAADHAMMYVYNKDGNDDWKSEGTEYNFDEELDTEKAEKRIMIVLDDCCGKYGTNPVRLNQMKEKLCRLQSLVKTNSGTRKVILTLTNAQFSLLDDSVKDADGQSIFKCPIKLSKISNEERIQVLEDYLKERNCRCQKCKDVPWVQVKGVIEEEMYLSSLRVIGWPLICRMVVIPQIAQNIGQFLEKPLIVLQEGLDKLGKADTAAYGGLVYMMLKGGTFDGNSIDHKCFRHVLQLLSVLPDHDIDLVFSTKLVIQHLKAIPEYVKYNHGNFTIFHEIVTLALFCSFYNKYPNETIQYCDLSIIAALFRPENYDSSAEGRVEPLLEALFTREDTSYTGRKTAENKTNPKCYFILSEKNHTVFMRRVVGEGKLRLYKGHPLVPEENYTQVK